jgi:hypothetical protein
MNSPLVYRPVRVPRLARWRRPPRDARRSIYPSLRWLCVRHASESREARPVSRMRHRSGTLPPAGGPERDAQLASDLLRSRREEITLALDLDDWDRACSARRSSPRAGFKQPACRPARSLEDRRHARRAAASSIATAAADPAKPSKAPSVSLLQRAAGTGSPWLITSWWSPRATKRAVTCVPSKPSTPVVPSDHDF